MNESSNAFSHGLGHRVREARVAKEWSQEVLSERSGVSRRMIINIEQGEANPSIATLLKLAYSLGVGLPSLVMADLSNTAATAGRTAVWPGKEGGYARLVTASDSGDTFELWDWLLQPGESHSSEPHVVGTRELIHVLEGTMTLTVSEEVKTLTQGAGYHFPGDQPHTYANTSEDPVRFVLSVNEPIRAQVGG